MGIYVHIHCTCTHVKATVPLLFLNYLQMFRKNSSVEKSCTRISLHVVTAQSCWKTFDKFCNLNEEEIIIKK